MKRKIVIHNPADNYGYKIPVAPNELVIRVKELYGSNEKSTLSYEGNTPVLTTPIWTVNPEYIILTLRLLEPADSDKRCYYQKNPTI